jgi:hypothetical protein
MLGFAILDQEAFQNLKIILFQSAITNTVQHDKQRNKWTRWEREQKKINWKGSVNQNKKPPESFPIFVVKKYSKFGATAGQKHSPKGFLAWPWQSRASATRFDVYSQHAGWCSFCNFSQRHNTNLGLW